MGGFLTWSLHTIVAACKVRSLIVPPLGPTQVALGIVVLLSVHSSEGKTLRAETTVHIFVARIPLAV